MKAASGTRPFSINNSMASSSLPVKKYAMNATFNLPLLFASSANSSMPRLLPLELYKSNKPDKSPLRNAQFSASKMFPRDNAKSPSLLHLPFYF
jgi:hypothetical protein